MVEGLSKKELSEAIEDGILNGFWKPIVYTAGRPHNIQTVIES